MNRFRFAFGSSAFSDRRLLLCAPRGAIGTNKECKRSSTAFASVKPLDDDDGDDQPPSAKRLKVSAEAPQESSTAVVDPRLCVVHQVPVSSMLLAAESRFFKSLLSNGMKESRQTDIVIEVANEREAAHVLALVKFLYTDELQLLAAAATATADDQLKVVLAAAAPAATTTTTGSSELSQEDLLALLLQADKLGIDTAVSKISRMLCAKIDTVETSAWYLDRLPESCTVNDSCRELLSRSRSFLATEFKEFDGKWHTDAFLSLGINAVCAVLSRCSSSIVSLQSTCLVWWCSDNLNVASENTVFRAAKRWWLQSPQSPRQQAIGVRSSDADPDAGQDTAHGLLKVDHGRDVKYTKETSLGCDWSKSFLKHTSVGTDVDTAKVDTAKVDTTKVGLVKVDTKVDTAKVDIAKVETKRECGAYGDGACADADADAAISLLQCVRFPALSSDFLLDVVQRDETLTGRAPTTVKTAGGQRAACALANATALLCARPGGRCDLSLTEVASAATESCWTTTTALPAATVSTTSSVSKAAVVMNALVHEALEYAASSSKRKRIAAGTRALLVKRNGCGTPDRVPGSAADFVTATWCIDNVTKMVEGKYYSSPSFHVAGYDFRLQTGRVSLELKDAGNSLALFLRVDTVASGLDRTSGFFLQTESQFSLRNWTTGQMEATHLPSYDTYTTRIEELGYFNVAKKSWSDFVASDYVRSVTGAMEISVRIRLITEA